MLAIPPAGRGDTLSGSAWGKPGEQGCADQRGASAHGEDRG
jgi:hypothetical protein